MRPLPVMLAVLLSLPVLAQDDELEETVKAGTLEESTGRLEDEISGFNIDQTITRTGHDFARYMSEYRNYHYPDAQYNLTIRERPSARWGNLIWVTYNYKVVYRRFLQPRNADVQKQAEQAAIQIHEMVQKEKLRQALEDHFDLGKDEF
ncbi:MULTISPECIES: curli production assembly/transport protein CsgE [Microbulbifer]|uniref:curli production assembly/transport protein CsgE n=1 Tax=Microbulbifer TaxID=48073 RepID=UPI001E5EE584|nr:MULTISPECIES: curli production assembly/transport protein CsgE [Microbulbifer]UHQ56610.1 curli production assembly/transport protein CsgE [Microbulbifer sp. YPW16]